MDKFRILFHKETGTYWTNHTNWKKLMKDSDVLYYYAEIDSDNIFTVKQVMNKSGYNMINNKEFKGTRLESTLKHNNNI